MMTSAVVVSVVGKVIVTLIVVLNLLQCSTTTITPSSIVSAAAAAITTKITTATVVFNKSIYFPGETMKINITRTDNKTSKDSLYIVIAPANVSDTALNDANYRDSLSNYPIQWNVKKDSMVFNICYEEYVHDGLYKAILLKRVEEKYTVLGVADNIQFNKPFVSINIPKKEFFQGEAVTFTFHNPYINLTYESNEYWLEPGHNGHRFKIVPTYPSIYEKQIPMKTGNSQVSETLIVPYNQDEYQIVLERIYQTYSQYMGPSEYTVQIAVVANSTFRVKRSYPILTMPRYSDTASTCSKEIVHVSLSTMNNIPLIGPYSVEIVSTDTDTALPFAWKTMTQKNGAKLDMVLNTTLSFQVPLGYAVNYRARILIDDSVWAMSSNYLLYGCVDPFSPFKNTYSNPM